MTIENTSRLQYKTPYYEIAIGPEENKLVVLPTLLHQLIERVEIIQTVATCGRNMLANISFVEGSREPFNTLDADTSSLYQVGGSSTGVLTNAPGMLGDLRFTSGGGEIGFTQLSKASILKAANVVSGVLNAISTKSIEVFEEPASEGPNENYVFKQGSYVRIKWGYKETPLQATFLGRIHVVSYEFSEGDHPKMNITVESVKTTLEQISAFEPTSFYNEIPSGTMDEDNQPIKRYEGLTVSELIKKVCGDAGFELILSDSFPADKLDADRNFVWPAGMSVAGVLQMLATRLGAIFYTTYNAVTGVPTIIFCNFTDFYSKEILHKSLFTWKGQNSIIKSLNIRVDYASLTGAGSVGISDKGEKVTSGTEVSTIGVKISEGKSGVVDTRSASSGKAFSSMKNNIAKGKQVNNINYNNETANSPANAKDLNNATAACAQNKLVGLEMVTLGHPLIRPGSINIAGIGNRYSALYYIKSCTHILSSEGYICNVTATSYGTEDGAVVKDMAAYKKAEEQGDIAVLISSKAGGSIASGAEIQDKVTKATIEGN